jgi:hypothetical protein
MRLSNRAVIIPLVCVAFGFVLSGFAPEPHVIAQTETNRALSRFQISAFAGQAGEHVHHGCYVVDTTTGKVWHVRSGGKPEIVAETLP